MTEFLNKAQEFFFNVSAYLENNFVKPYFGKIQTLLFAVSIVLAILFLIIAIVNGAKKNKFKKKLKNTNAVLAEINNKYTKLSTDYQVDLEKLNALTNDYSNVINELNQSKEEVANLNASNYSFEQANAELANQISELRVKADKYDVLEALAKKKKAKADKERKINKAKAEKAEIAAKLKELEELKAEKEKAKREATNAKALEELKVVVAKPEKASPAKEAKKQELTEKFTAMKMADLFDEMRKRKLPISIGMKKADVISTLVDYDVK